MIPTYDPRMSGRWRHAVVGLATLAVGLVVAPLARGQDKPVLVADTDPAPVVIDGGTFFLASGQVAMSVRNRHTAPVLVTLRAWVFDRNGRLRGTGTYCVPEWLDRGTRRVMTMMLGVQDIETSDEVVVAVDSAASDRRQWRAAGQDVLAQARRVRSGFPGRLRLDEQPTTGPAPRSCPCECDAVAEACDAWCAGSALRAFTCDPVMIDGCSASCSCR